MGVLEWLGAHGFGFLVGFVNRFLSKPKPELKIHELAERGGDQSAVDFAATIQNVGTKSARVVVTAHIDDEQVQVDKPSVELLPSGPSQTVRILVPRPQLGNLVPAFHNETTIYNRTLTVEIADGRHRATCDWREIVYDPVENAARYEIQQREWRIGRGEASEADYRSDAQSELLRKHHNRVERDGRGTPGADG
jgi:hypothetical protein